MAIQGAVESRTEFVDATLLVTRYDAQASLKSHIHREPYVSIVVDGRYTEVSGRAARLCTPGTVLIHNPKETHADYFLEPARLLNIEIAELESSASIRGMVAGIARSTLCPVNVRSALQAATRSLADVERVNLRPPPWLGAALEDFGSMHGSDIGSVAERVGIHPTHFSRSFRTHVGVTPSLYRARERVRLASGLLLSTSRRVASIALECGFSDQSHLTRVFRALVGMTPGAFRAVFCR